jgi:hypothetical protein
MSVRRDRANTITKHIGIPLDISKGIEEAEVGIIVNGYFTSDEKDEVGDIITKEATENAIPKYRQWGNIRYMHQAKPVAKVLAIGKDDGLKWNEVRIQVLDPEAVFQVRNGLLKALSVGIIIWSFDDIEMLDDGTWIIHNYDLVEISLVDHPANYDAQLFLDEDKAVAITNDIRQMATAQGLTMVAKVLGATVAPSETTLEEESDMADNKELLPEGEEIVEELEETEAEEVELDLESEDIDEEEIEEEVEEIELSLEETEEEVVEEELALEPEEEILEAEEELSVDSEEEEEITVEMAEEDEGLLDISEEETIEESDAEAENTFTFAPETIQEIVNLVVRGLAEALAEASPEVLEEEQVEVELDADVDEPAQEDEMTLEDAQVKIASLQAQLDELTAPDERDGKIITGELPHEVVEEIDEEEESSESKGVLNDALAKYMSQDPVVVIRRRS